MRSARVSSALGALWVLSLPLPVAASAEDLPAVATARLDVQALPDCTSREELVARVTARSRRIRFVDAAARVPLVRAVIAPGPRSVGVAAELVIVQPDGRSSSRRLSASSCAEATDAIALIIALTFDPAVAPTAPVPATAAPAESAQAAPKAAEAPPRAHPQAPEGPSAPAAGDEISAGRSAPSPPVATHRQLGAGAGAQAIFGAAPSLLPGLAVYAEAALDRDALWSPAIILGGIHAFSRGLVEPGGTAAFTFDAVSLDACALRIQLSVFDARACATGLYGRLSADGSDTYSPTSVARPYAVAGGTVLLIVELGRVLELSGRFGAGASLVRDSFGFTAAFHRTAAVTMTSGIGLGVRFP